MRAVRFQSNAQEYKLKDEIERIPKLELGQADGKSLFDTLWIKICFNSSESLSQKLKFRKCTSFRPERHDGRRQIWREELAENSWCWSILRTQGVLRNNHTDGNNSLSVAWEARIHLSLQSSSLGFSSLNNNLNM